MSTTTKTLSEITDEAIAILCRDLGVVETLRFIRQFSNGLGDYTKERQERHDPRTVNDIVEQIKQERRFADEGSRDADK